MGNVLVPQSSDHGRNANNKRSSHFTGTNKGKTNGSSESLISNSDNRLLSSGCCAVGTKEANNYALSFAQFIRLQRILNNQIGEFESKLLAVEDDVSKALNSLKKLREDYTNIEMASQHEENNDTKNEEVNPLNLVKAESHSNKSIWEKFENDVSDLRQNEKLFSSGCGHHCHKKEIREKKIIYKSLMGNEFLKCLDSVQIKNIIEYMYPREYEKGTYVTREGDNGAHLFVAEKGNFVVSQEANVLGYFGPNTVFGEIAMLYGCARTATVKVVSDNGKLWILDRDVIQFIVSRAKYLKFQDSIQMLLSVPSMQQLPPDLILKLASNMSLGYYDQDEIITQDDNADARKIYLIVAGVVIILNKTGPGNSKTVTALESGDYFGNEMSGMPITAQACSPGVECYILDASLIKKYLPSRETKNIDFVPSTEDDAYSVRANEIDAQIEDFNVITTIGKGSSGEVKLVYYNNRVYALKCIWKRTIRKECAEVAIMFNCVGSNFICRLYKSFEDSNCVYLLMDACMGGTVYQQLRTSGQYSCDQARFIVACVLEGLSYLHNRRIIHRDIKLENLFFDHHGYVKLGDFGHATVLEVDKNYKKLKKYSVCGTPVYMAPEVYMHQGHNEMADFWSCGIAVYELLYACVPHDEFFLKPYDYMKRGIKYSKVDNPSAVQFVKELLVIPENERLGYNGGVHALQEHSWFDQFEWNSLKNFSMESPVQVSIITDTSKFKKLTGSKSTLL